ncbi:MAG: hydrogenase maturation nickel metallochaperone HypA [Gemmatimonadaceae bacterium]|jgi:Zn finger protein HypA/HybF involved in hydrogenase expression|nr:hydrogenase maturation nickel metallochaperone HypA [Gemmatimonadaceae bacterium]
MHELSIALEVCAIAERTLGDRVPQLTRVGLEVGDGAGIVVENLTFCLDTLLTEPPFRGAGVEVSAVAGDVLRVSYLEVDDERSAH